MPSNYQVQLVNATAINQNILTNKQASDAEGGTYASDLLTSEYNASSAVLTVDADNVDSAGTAAQQGSWTQEDTNAYNQANSIYQNDTLTAEIGQSNANVALNQMQTEVGQDGTNLSNFLSIANILVNIGSYVSSLLRRKYA